MAADSGGLTACRSDCPFARADPQCMGSATVENRGIYRLAGRVGGYARAALYDGREMTAAARQRFIESFREGHDCRVCPRVELPADLLPAERERRAEALRRLHYARVALASARKRAEKKAATPAKVTAQEDRDATSSPRRSAA
jgi:hypothetical protein